VKDDSSLGSTATDPARTAMAKRKYLLAFQKALHAPERVSFPVIAALHGHVIGVGVDMIGGCDVRLAAEDAKFCVKVSISRAYNCCSIFNTLRIGSRHWIRPWTWNTGLSTKDNIQYVTRARVNVYSTNILC